MMDTPNDDGVSEPQDIQISRCLIARICISENPQDLLQIKPRPEVIRGEVQRRASCKLSVRSIEALLVRGEA